MLAAVAASVGTRYSLKFLVDAMAATPRGAAGVWSAAVLFTGLVGADNLLWRLGGWAAARAFPAVAADLRLDLFRHLLGHSTRFFGEHFAGALANRIGTAGTAVFTILNALAWNVLPPAFAVVASLLMLLPIEPAMTLVLGACVLAIAGLMAAGALRGRPLHLAYAGEAAAAGGEIVDVVANHGTVRAFAALPRECDRLGVRLAAEAAAQRRSLFYLERLRTAYALGLTALTGAMLAWAVLLWQRGTISAGDVVVIGSFSLALLQASRDLAVALVEITQHWSRLAEALASLTRPHDLTDSVEAQPLLRCGGEIAFEAVGFAYGGGRPVLEAVTLRIPPGQKVGIVGPSGAGKTTLLALAQRLHRVAEGRILIDGQDVATMTETSLRRAIAVVPQEVVLFHRTIRENIRYGRPDASDEAVLEAARAAQCEAFISELPEGYDTLVGERGARLSGGQRQRIGIARAILADTPVVFLDEATSALDTRSEFAIQRALANLMRGRTVLAVAHRLSTIAHYDRVIVLDGGRVVEDGPPDELVRSDGLFSALWRMQARAAGTGRPRAVPEAADQPRLAANAGR